MLPLNLGHCGGKQLDDLTDFFGSETRFHFEFLPTESRKMPGDQCAGGIRIFPAQTNGHPHDRTLVIEEFGPDAFPFLFDGFHVGTGRFEGVLAPGFFPRWIEVELRASEFQPAVLFFRGFGGVARLAFDKREGFCADGGNGIRECVGHALLFPDLIQVDLATRFFHQPRECESDRLRAQAAGIFRGEARTRFEQRPENGVGLWGLGSMWSDERDQVADFSAAKKLPSVIRC